MDCQWIMRVYPQIGILNIHHTPQFQLNQIFVGRELVIPSDEFGRDPEEDEVPRNYNPCCRG